MSASTEGPSADPWLVTATVTASIVAIVAVTSCCWVIAWAKKGKVNADDASRPSTPSSPRSTSRDAPDAVFTFAKDEDGASVSSFQGDEPDAPPPLLDIWPSAESFVAASIMGSGRPLPALPALGLAARGRAMAESGTGGGPLDAGAADPVVLRRRSSGPVRATGPADTSVRLTPLNSSRKPERGPVLPFKPPPFRPAKAPASRRSSQEGIAPHRRGPEGGSDPDIPGSACNSQRRHRAARGVRVANNDVPSLTSIEDTAPSQTAVEVRTPTTPPWPGTNFALGKTHSTPTSRQARPRPLSPGRPIPTSWGEVLNGAGDGGTGTGMFGTNAAPRPHEALLTRRGASLDGTTPVAGSLHGPRSFPARRDPAALSPIPTSGRAAPTAPSGAAPAEQADRPTVKRKAAKVYTHHYDPDATVGGNFRNILSLKPLGLRAAGSASIRSLTSQTAADPLAATAPVHAVPTAPTAPTARALPDSHRDHVPSAHGKPMTARPSSSATRWKRPSSAARRGPEQLPPLAVDLPGTVTQDAHVDPVAVIRRTSLPSDVAPSIAAPRQGPPGRQPSTGGWRRGSVKRINMVTPFVPGQLDNAG